MKATQSSQDKHPVEPKYPVPDSRRPAELEGDVFSPPVDVYESGEEFTVRADVPGTAREDIDVCVEEDTMTLTAPVEGEPDGEPASVEYPLGHWFRRFTLSGVDVAEVEATLQHGVLTVRLPKVGGAERKKIEIK